MIKRGRIEELDLVRAIAIMAVVAIHSTTNPIINLDVNSVMYPIYNFINTFSTFSVPTFILLSGIVLFYNYYPKDFGPKVVKDFYFKRIMYIAIPYISISLLYFIFNQYYLGKTPTGIFIDFLRKLLTGRANYQLYYMVVIIQFYLAFPIFLGLIKRYNWLAKNSLWLGILLQWIFWYVNSHYIHYSRTSIISLTYFSYFFVGAFIGIYYEKAKIWLFESFKLINLKMKLFRILLFFVWLFSTVFYIYLYYHLRIKDPVNVDTTVYTILYNIFTLTTGLIIYQLAVVVYKKYSRALWVRALNVIGMISFGIYLIHPFFYIYYNKIPYSGNSLIYNFQIGMKFLVGMILSWILVYYMSKYVKISWVLFGKSSITQNNKPLDNAKTIEVDTKGFTVN